MQKSVTAEVWQEAGDTEKGTLDKSTEFNETRERVRTPKGGGNQGTPGTQPIPSDLAGKKQGE